MVVRTQPDATEHDQSRSGLTDSSYDSEGAVLAVFFSLWTLFVWVGRLRNLAEEPGSLLGDGPAVIVLISLAFVATAALLLVAAVATLSRNFTRAQETMRDVLPGVIPDAFGGVLQYVGSVLGAFTILMWIPRSLDIIVSDHSVGFKVVHTLLAVVSIGLAWLVLRHNRAKRKRPRAATGSAIGA